MTYLLIALGGALGALARFAIGGWVTAWAGAGLFPWGTFAINVAGSLLLGIVLQALPAPAVSPDLRALLAVGFCGSFTTFSTFGYETVLLLGSGGYTLAATYVCGSVLLSLAGVGAGIWLGALIA